MKKLICSKWSKRFLWFIIISTFLTFEYILLFVGTGNTYIDNACIPICLIAMVIAMVMIIVRSFLIDYWSANMHLKIYIPKSENIKESILKQINMAISNEKECDYIGRRSDYRFYKELTQEEFDALPIQSQEHEIGNVLLYDDGQTFILDGFGYCKIRFE